MSNFVCPICEGRKRALAHINRGSAPHSWEKMDCRACAGTGMISAETATAIANGRSMRERRIARDESLREAAKRLGVSPAELSRIEHGYPSPPQGRDE